MPGTIFRTTNFRELARLAAGDTGIALERARADFTTLLANCELSVSQAGYNTLMEIVQARARCVVVPFAGGHETEQTLRARCFAERGLLELVEESALTPGALAAAIDRAARKPRPAPGAIDLDGARRSAALIARHGERAHRMNAAWRSLSDEIARWRDAGRMADFWWRDDDAARPEPALTRLLALVARIPRSRSRSRWCRWAPIRSCSRASAARCACCSTEPITAIGPGPAKRKPNFPLPSRRRRRSRGWSQRASSCKPWRAIAFVAVLAPPWNRLPEALVPHLAAPGYAGLSLYGPRRSAYPAKTLKQVNTHVDIIAWRSGRGFLGRRRRRSRRRCAIFRASALAAVDSAEATGLLTHHALHDAAAWDFLRTAV